MKIKATINIEGLDDKIWKVFDEHISKDIKGRCSITFGENTLIIESQDINAFKISINSILRVLKAIEAAMDIG